MITTTNEFKRVDIGSVIKVAVNNRFRIFQIVREVSGDDDESLIAYDTSLGRNLVGRKTHDQFSHILFDGSQVSIRVLQIS